MSDEKLRKPVLTLTRTMIWLLVVGYGLFLVGRSTYQNYGINKQIDAQKELVRQLEMRKQNLELSLYYYRSKAFQEVEARQRLNLKGKGEHVVALPDAVTEPMLTIVTTSPIKDNKAEKPPIYKQWWILFFGETKQKKTS